MKASRELADAFADKLDLPGELSAGCLTLCGGRQALIEGHRGLLAFSPECLVVSLGRQRLRLLGADLRIRAMSRDRLLVSGRIQRVEME